MNHIIITGTLLEPIQLAYTQNGDRQVTYTTFGIRFADPNPKSSSTFPLRIYVYGKAAEELASAQYAPGDTVLVQGKMNVATIEKESYKEKRGNIEASRVERIATASAPQAPPAQPPAQTPQPQPAPPPPIPTQAPPPPAPQPTPTYQQAPPQSQTQAAPPPPAQTTIPLPQDNSLDQIPF